MACIGLVQASNEGDYLHLMTVNTTDGSVSWAFTSPLWYSGDFGYPETGQDFISDKVRNTPMKGIRIESTNELGEVATKEYVLKD